MNLLPLLKKPAPSRVGQATLLIQLAAQALEGEPGCKNEQKRLLDIGNGLRQKDELPAGCSPTCH